MSAETLVAVVAGATLALGVFVALLGAVAERRRRADLPRVLAGAEHLRSVATRAENGEFDDPADRGERLNALRLEALEVFDGVLLRDLVRDRQLAEVYAQVSGTMIRLRAGPVDGPPVTRQDG